VNLSKRVKHLYDNLYGCRSQVKYAKNQSYGNKPLIKDLEELEKAIEDCERITESILVKLPGRIPK
jgi:hypothetical protein